ncbi:cyd operon YbgE family protein [Modicisalibacter radicis]|uniref:cyd operon YbgE family protein n=1 Tax=Halomonas sp. EAR18 TaxID=2518972 RepID=UPI00109C8BB9|nr:cyd operon YbgE family protein [Halomonas sp. EAR18]
MLEASYRQGARLLALVATSAMALMLLLRPEIVSGLTFAWRLPLWLLGVWALGAGFAHGAGLTVRPGPLRRWLGPPWCWVALGVFGVLLLLRL